MLFCNSKFRSYDTSTKIWRKMKKSHYKVPVRPVLVIQLMSA